MSKYILKRTLYALLTLWALATITFFIMRLLPGDPFIGDKALTATAKAAMNAKYGLDKPVGVQYLIFMGNLLKGDMGLSTHYNRPVNTIIAQAFPYSFDLGIRALVFAVIGGIFAGSLAALYRGTWVDTTTMIISIVGVSIPSFIMGALMQYFIALKLGAAVTGTAFAFLKLPVIGFTTGKHKILPAIALGFGSLATLARLTRTSMLDVLSQDYIKTAKAKGLSSAAITWRHALRNALLQVVTVLGPIAAAVLTGAFVVENIFNIPGMGKFFVQSVGVRDYSMIAGTTVFYGAFLVVANLLVDIAYGVIDPRIRLSASAKG
ncbi:MAG: ABC transporter permease [Eubacteriales bacterium]|nr:ABC transporter permease [Eubacteriales bacterium]